MQLGVSWSGLGSNKRYLGGAQFLDLNGVVQATTALRVETGAAVTPGGCIFPQCRSRFAFPPHHLVMIAPGSQSRRLSRA